MKVALSVIICVLLFIYINYILEDFVTTSSESSNSESSNSESSNSESSNSESSNSESSNSVTTSSTDEKPNIKYFELNNEAKNLVNSYKYETQLREIAREEKEMRNNVRKISNHAENVLAFTELNKDYLDKVLVKNTNSD